MKRRKPVRRTILQPFVSAWNSAIGTRARAARWSSRRTVPPARDPATVGARARVGAAVAIAACPALAAAHAGRHLLRAPVRSRWLALPGRGALLEHAVRRLGAAVSDRAAPAPSLGVRAARPGVRARRIDLDLGVPRRAARGPDHWLRAGPWAWASGGDDQGENGERARRHERHCPDDTPPGSSTCVRGAGRRNALSASAGRAAAALPARRCAA